MNLNQCFSVVTKSIIAMIVVFQTACVTETVEREPGMKFTDAAVVSVQNPTALIPEGAKVAWHPEAVRFIKDERLADTQVKKMIEQQIVANLKLKGLTLVNTLAEANYAIAYTAALESALDDASIIRRYGLLPGNAQVPTDDKSIEKGSLIIYMFENAAGGVIWRSAAQAGVHFDMDEGQRRKRVEAVVTTMFQSLPVKLNYGSH